MNSQKPMYEMRYVPGHMLPNYDDYCPLTYVHVRRESDGLWRGYWLDQELVLNDGDFVEDPGFLVVQLGLIERDYTLETAANAIFNSLKSLFASCNIPVDFEKIRTTVEMSEFMKKYRSTYSHMVLIGHGNPSGISFLDKREPIAGSELSGYLGSDFSEKGLQIISLCCHSGCQPLAKALSEAANVTDVIAPSRTFDMRWAVHFVTGYFLQRFVSGRNVDDAVASAVENSGNTDMCVWRRGTLVGECATRLLPTVLNPKHCDEHETLGIKDTKN